MEPYFISEEIYSGSIKFHPDVYFYIHHHEAFGYSKDLNKFALNKTPWSDPIFSEIKFIEKTEDGLILIEKNKSKKIKYSDKTKLQKILTLYLLKFIKNFKYEENINQLLSIEYVENFLTKIRISTYGSLDPKYLSIVRAADGNLYTGEFPLSDDYSIPLTSIGLKGKSIVINNEKSPIYFEVNLQDDIAEMLFSLLRVGFSDEYIKI